MSPKPTGALENAGDRSAAPATAEDRRDAAPITNANLPKSRQTLQKTLAWATLIHVLTLPITLLFLFHGVLITIVIMPWRLWKAWGCYRDLNDQREHQKLVNRVPEAMEFFETDTEDYPQLDATALVHYTHELEMLGFVHAFDYSVHADISLGSTGFARLYFHPTAHCFAEVNQVFPFHARPSDMRCTVASFFQDGWSLSTMNRAPNATMYAWRLPKSVWSSHPDMPLVELWTEHLNRRERMLAVLGVVLVTELSLESYFARQRQILAERKAAINIKSLATIKAEMESFERSPVYEWLGDFSLHDDASKHP